MAADVETDEAVGTDELTDDEPETASGGDSTGGGEGEGEKEKPDEPFLAIDDRTVYKDPESAKKGWQELNGTLGRYRKHGTPEEIERRLAEAKAREELIDTLKTGSKAEQAEAKKKWLDALPADTRKRWEQLRPGLKEIIEEEIGDAKALKKEIEALKKARETDKQQSETKQLERFRDRTIGVLDKILKDSGKTLTAAQKRGLQITAIEIANDVNDPDGEQLRKAYTAEDAEAFALKAAQLYLGEEAIKTTPNGSKQGAGDDRPRDPETGKFLSEEQIAARKRSAAADKASRLASAPPKDGSAASEQGDKKELPPIHKRTGLFASALKAARGKG